MKKILNLFLILITISVYSQKMVDANVVTKSDETISSKLRVYTNIFYKDLIDESSFYRILYLVDDNGSKKEKIKAENVKELRFVDLKGKERIYVNNGKFLKEFMYNGNKIKWYRDISQNLYDGSIQYFDYLVDNNGTIYKMGLFNNAKKKLLEATKTKPELATEIENAKLNDEVILDILKKFDSN
ncbi:hypothetical protein [Chryseobacterium koreense]